MVRAELAWVGEVLDLGLSLNLVAPHTRCHVPNFVNFVHQYQIGMSQYFKVPSINTK